MYKVLTEHRDKLDRRDYKVYKVNWVHRDCKVYKGLVYKEQVVHKGYKAHKDNRALKAIKAFKVKLDHRVYKGYKVNWVHRDYRDCKVSKGLVYKE